MTGSGGLAGVNFVRALKASKRNYYVVGADFNMYHLVYPDVDARYRTPRHTDASFIPRIAQLVREERIDFLHPQPSSEALAQVPAGPIEEEGPGREDKGGLLDEGRQGSLR